jgi:hypothetical protein
MEKSDIDKIELKYLEFEDYLEIKDVMKSAYSSLPDPYYVKKQGFQLFFSVKTNIFTFSPCNQPLSRG